MDNFESAHFLHSSIFHPLLRQWQAMESSLAAHNLIYPLFLIGDDDKVEEISSMPGVCRYGVNRAIEHLAELTVLGLRSVLIFGIVSESDKTPDGRKADSSDSPVVRGTRAIAARFPDLLIICDVCLCHYTSHGHCGVLNQRELIDNAASIKRLSEVAVNYVKAGAHVVAPSDMMDCRIGAIKKALSQSQYGATAAVMSYSAKFASSFYGPFRAAAGSAPLKGGRHAYQLPSQARGLARRASFRDASQGADILMVKPAGPYLDIVRDIRSDHPNHPLAVYQVGGEYAMLYWSAQNGVFSLREGVMETVHGFFRAGANLIITYYTPQILRWLSEA